MHTDVHAALDLAIDPLSLPEIVRFGVLLPQAISEARLAVPRSIVRLVEEGNYDAAFRHIALLTDPPLAPTRYRLLLIVAWLAALKRDYDRDNAAYHLNTAREALHQPLQTQGTIPAAWSAVVLNLVEVLLEKGITEATALLKGFGRLANKNDVERVYACRYLAQVAQSLPASHVPELCRLAEEWVKELPAGERPEGLGYVASTYAKRGCEGDAERICEELVRQYERECAQRTDPDVARLAELITERLGDISDRDWAAGVCAQLRPNDTCPVPLRGYVLACISERLWKLEAYAEGEAAIDAAIQAAEAAVHPLAQARVLERVVMAALQVRGASREERLLRLLRLSDACLDRHLKRIPDSQSLYDWLNESGISLRRVQPLEQVLWERTRAECLDAERDWIRQESDLWPYLAPIRSLLELACDLLQELKGSGVWEEARQIVSTVIWRANPIGRRAAYEELAIQLEMARQLDVIGEGPLASEAVRAFRQPCNHFIFIPLIPMQPMSERETIQIRPREWLFMRRLTNYLGRFCLNDDDDFQTKHYDQFGPLLDQCDAIRQGFRAALHDNDFDFFQNHEDMDELDEGFDADREDGSIRDRHLEGTEAIPIFRFDKRKVPPSRGRLVGEAEECIRRGEYSEAAKRFAEDVGWTSDFARQAEWFPRFCGLGLARQLGLCGQVGRAIEPIRDLIRKVNPGLLAAPSGEMDEFLLRIVHILTERADEPFAGGLEATTLSRIEYFHQLADLEDDPFLIVVSAQAYLRGSAQENREKVIRYLHKVLRLVEQPQQVVSIVPELLKLANECSTSEVKLRNWTQDILGVIYEILEALPNNKLDLSVASTAAQHIYRQGNREKARHIFDRCREKALECGRHIMEQPLDRVKDVMRERLLSEASNLRAPGLFLFASLEDRAVAMATVFRGLTQCDEKWADEVFEPLSETIERSLQLATVPQKVRFLCQVAEALADCTYRIKGRVLLTRATDILRELKSPKEQEAMFAQVAKAMLRTGQRSEALAYAERWIPHVAIREEFYIEYAGHAATASREDAERAYRLLIEKIPPDRQGDTRPIAARSRRGLRIRPDEHGDKWTQVMAMLLATLGRDQGWPSEWARRLAGLLCIPNAEQLTAFDVDLVLRALVSLCNDDDILLQTAAVYREILEFVVGRL